MISFISTIFLIIIPIIGIIISLKLKYTWETYRNKLLNQWYDWYPSPLPSTTTPLTPSLQAHLPPYPNATRTPSPLRRLDSAKIHTHGFPKMLVHEFDYEPPLPRGVDFTNDKSALDLYRTCPRDQLMPEVIDAATADFKARRREGIAQDLSDETWAERQERLRQHWAFQED
ncbi:hypothetical protein EJ04DRAFT_508081 [Polyplosphaeria fusca]|uniref:Uncharacterized protein n=1 Tax=Polyplosphaeria fusca TaxID=682080 RepID=A0A9P4V918_9PLEO|nr:hypothetical protein EJ04DRAFT_508081 [Polyplosphaeria fusca]